MIMMRLNENGQAENLDFSNLENTIWKQDLFFNIDINSYR
ncbi:hypothetical protein HMPREF9406_1083 [Clostridium sp. HGF2]|nr:hypothetical protein HMPREF9406_1083 [Clostridium sp. HGF2]